MSEEPSHAVGALSLSIMTGAKKTFRNPLTYIGATIVGGLSLLTRDYEWGVLTPFFIPLIVHAAIRILAEYEYRAMFAGKTNVVPDDNPEIANIYDISTFSALFHRLQETGEPHLLIKIQINPASEVIRLNEPNGLTAESAMIRRIETIIQQNFEDGIIAKVSFNAFMVVLTGDYETHESRLHDFIDDNSPCKIEIKGRIYLPKLLIGITPLGSHAGESFSRLEFSIQKAFLSAGRAYWYVSEDSKEFNLYRQKRLGLRAVRQALDSSELGLYAQPIVALGDTPKENKYEILLRHYRTDSTVESPVEILKHANFNKMSQEIDLYVINLLCQNYHQLDNADKDAIYSISINLTSSSFTSPRFAGLLRDLVSTYDVPKGKIILEITETIANQNISTAIKTMEKLKNSGFKLALDDIGIGSSNFHNLSHFPVDYYKIDRIYSEEILTSPETRRFIQLVIDIGKSKGKKIIAEGIPDEETLKILTEMGIDYSQSFLTGIPKELIKAPKFDTNTSL